MILFPHRRRPASIARDWMANSDRYVLMGLGGSCSPSLGGLPLMDPRGPLALQQPETRVAGVVVAPSQAAKFCGRGPKCGQKGLPGRVLPLLRGLPHVLRPAPFPQILQKPTHELKQQLAGYSKRVASSVTELIQAAEAMKGECHGSVHLWD